MSQADNYLHNVVSQHTASDGDRNAAVATAQALLPYIHDWAGDSLSNVYYSGSYAKGTGLKTSTDIDFFISLIQSCPQPLKEIYNLLFQRCEALRLQPKKQNVSINVRLDGRSIDLVPAKRQDTHSFDHSLYRRRADTWTKTNVETHRTYVIGSGRRGEIILAKRWRNLNALEWPSFYVELAVIDALSGKSQFDLANNFWDVLMYIRDRFEARRIIDPANTNNIVSDDLTSREKKAITQAAETALSKKTWGEIVW